MMQFRGEKLRKVVMGAVLSASICLAGASPTLATHQNPFHRQAGAEWLSGDFHQHTLYTDGSTTFDFVMEKNNEFGLDWRANSEHGGNRDGEGVSWLDSAKYPEKPRFG